MSLQRKNYYKYIKSVPEYIWHTLLNKRSREDNMIKNSMRKEGVRIDDIGRKLPHGISQRKDGRYIWRFTYEGIAYPPVYDKDLNRLKEISTIKKAEILQGVFTMPVKMTLNHYFAHYMETYKKGIIKAVSYENSMNYWKWYVQDSIGKRQMQKIKRADFINLYKKLQTREVKPISWETVKRIHNMVENVLEKAYVESIIPKNPASRILEDIPKLTEGKVREALAPEQVNLFLDYIDSHRFYRYHKNFFSVLLGTGLRVGECCGLCEEDVNLEEGYMKIYKTLYYRNSNGTGRRKLIGGTKSKSGTRTLPLLNGVRCALENQLQFKQDTKLKCKEAVESVCETGDVEKLKHSYLNFIFLTQEKTAYTPDYVTQIIKKVVRSYNKAEVVKAKEEGRQAIELPEFSAHYTRHTFATRAEENGVSVGNIALWLGHSKNEGSKTTRRYIHKSWADGWKELVSDVELLDGIRIV
jgi:integrase